MSTPQGDRVALRAPLMVVQLPPGDRRQVALQRGVVWVNAGSGVVTRDNGLAGRLKTPVRSGDLVVARIARATQLWLESTSEALSAWVCGFALDGHATAIEPAALHVMRLEPQSLAAQVCGLVNAASCDGVRAHLLTALLAEIDSTRHPAQLLAQTARAESRDAVVARAVQLLAQDVGKNWTLNGLSRTLGVSRAALLRRFGRAVGQPPLQFLTRLRLLHVAELLSATDQSLAELAYRVGYASESALSRAFKRQYEVAPGEYRRLSRLGGTERGALIDVTRSQGSVVEPQRRWLERGATHSGELWVLGRSERPIARAA